MVSCDLRIKKKGIKEIPEIISFMTVNISKLDVGVNISNITVIPSLSLRVQEMEKNGLNSTAIYFSGAGTNLLRCKHFF